MGSAIYRRRGDTYPVELTITNESGVPQDIDGKAFVLTASEEEDPVDATHELFQLVGEIIDAPNGLVHFPMADEQADHVGEFFFDVEMTDLILESQLWVPDGVDDEDVVMDGSEFWYRADQFAAGEYDVKYATRDGIKVAAISGVEIGERGLFLPIGDEAAVQSLDPAGIYEYEFLLYMVGNPNTNFEIDFAFYYDPVGRINFFYVQSNWNGSTLVMSGETTGPNTPTTEDFYHFGSASYTPEPADGWIRWKTRIDYGTLTLSAKAWTEGATEPDWQATGQGSNQNLRWPVVVPTIRFDNPGNTNVLEIASYLWKKVAP